MTSAELAILFTALLTFGTAVANLMNSLSNRSHLREIKRNTDGMTERLELAARKEGAALEAQSPSTTKKEKSHAT